MSRPLKVHGFSGEPERGMPIDVSRDYYAQGLRGTKCGYMRKVSFDESKVTCLSCLREMSKERAQ